MAGLHVHGTTRSAFFFADGTGADTRLHTACAHSMHVAPLSNIPPPPPCHAAPLRPQAMPLDRIQPLQQHAEEVARRREASEEAYVTQQVDYMKLLQLIDASLQLDAIWQAQGRAAAAARAQHLHHDIRQMLMCVRACVCA
jgi:hypothetical protein